MILYICIKDVIDDARCSDYFAKYILWPKGSIAYFEEIPDSEYWMRFQGDL